MDHLEGAGLARGDRVDFDRRVRLEFRGAQISSDGGLLVMRELDDVLGLSNLASEALRDSRTGKNTLHRLDGLFRQSVFGRLAGYEDVNDADRLALDPVMRQVVGGRAVEAQAASASQMGRFETETLALAANRAALADLNGQWIDRFHDRNGLQYIVLDMDSSVSPTHGDQEGAAWNGHFDCTCYHPNFLFNQFGMLERRPGGDRNRPDPASRRGGELPELCRAVAVGADVASGPARRGASIGMEIGQHIGVQGDAIRVAHAGELHADHAAVLVALQ